MLASFSSYDAFAGVSIFRRHAEFCTLHIESLSKSGSSPPPRERAMPKEHDTDRSARLLRTMHPVLSHDLPNQLVALQGLLQMLELAEAPVLAAPSHETFYRLQRVARKTSEMVRFLKELERLGSYQCRLEEIRLNGLVREVKVQLQQRCPELSLEYALAGDPKTVVADAHLLTHALVELLRCLLETKLVDRVAMQFAAQRLGKDTELRGELRWPSKPAEPATLAVPSDRVSLEKRLEIVLAEELLTVCGGRLTEVKVSADCSRFALLLPHPSAHA
jgi:hypothetical protein